MVDSAPTGGSSPVAEFHYRIGWRSGSPLPGAHASRRLGPGVDFYGHVSLLETTDPRRFDVLATQRDPQRSLRLRAYRQLGSIPVTALLDVSASMPAAAGGTLDLMADFVAALGFSAVRTGDSFGVISADTQVRRELCLPTTRRRGAGLAHAQRLRSFQPDGNGARGLLAATHYLPRQRGLLFFLSDFHFPLADLERLMAALGGHDVVPVPIWSEAERQLPNFGLVRLRDAESGHERLLVMRPSLRKRIERQVDEHRSEVLRTLSRHGRRPLMLGTRFDAETVSRYFYG
ncbi:MAG: VWA domain-containing protein [Pseudomonadota bacterium]